MKDKRAWYCPRRRRHLSVRYPDDQTQLIVETFRGRYSVRILRDGAILYRSSGSGSGFTGRYQVDEAYRRLEETGVPE